MSKFCPNCGAPTPEGAKFCASCGQTLVQTVTPEPEKPVAPAVPQPAPKKVPEYSLRFMIALLCIIGGYTGIQYFLLGKKQAGILTIVLTVVTCGTWAIANIVNGILLLNKTDEEFIAKYIQSDGMFPIF